MSSQGVDILEVIFLENVNNIIFFTLFIIIANVPQCQEK